MLDVLWFYRNFIQYAICGLLFAVALRKGAAPERLLSGGLVGMVLAVFVHPLLIGQDPISALVFGPRFRFSSIELAHAIEDIVFFGFTWYVALRANRIYPLWIAGAQLISVMSHVYRVGFEHIHPVVYAVMMRMPFYIELIAMTVGLVCHIRRTRRIGSYPSWRSSFAPSSANAQLPTPAV